MSGPMYSDKKFVEDVAAELLKARAKFPSSALSLAALTEELGELARAMLHLRAGKTPAEHVWQEAVQVAAMVQRVAVEGDPSFDVVDYKEPDGWLPFI